MIDFQQMFLEMKMNIKLTKLRIILLSIKRILNIFLASKKSRQNTKKNVI